MLQINRYDAITYRIDGTERDWAVIDAVLNYAVEIYDDTELETLLVELQESDNGKLEHFKNEVMMLTGSGESYRLWDNYDYGIISTVILELYNFDVPGLEIDLQKGVYFQFGKLRQEKNAGSVF